MEVGAGVFPPLTAWRRDSAKMPTPLIVGAGSALVAAALFASAATATALAGVLFYLAPLPLCLATLGWGTTAGLTSALAGTLVIALGLGPAAAGLFALSLAAPIAFLTRLALLSRPVPAAGGAPNTALEWYPPGRLVGWAALIAGLLAALLVLVLGYDQESYQKSIREVLSHSALKDLDTDGTLYTLVNGLSSNAVLARVNQTTGAVTPIGAGLGTTMITLEIAADGTMYGIGVGESKATTGWWGLGRFARCSAVGRSG